MSKRNSPPAKITIECEGQTNTIYCVADEYSCILQEQDLGRKLDTTRPGPDPLLERTGPLAFSVEVDLRQEILPPEFRVGSRGADMVAYTPRGKEAWRG